MTYSTKHVLPVDFQQEIGSCEYFPLRGKWDLTTVALQGQSHKNAASGFAIYKRVFQPMREHHEVNAMVVITHPISEYIYIYRTMGTYTRHPDGRGKV
jgi:hypothetical protein